MKQNNEMNLTNIQDDMEVVENMEEDVVEEFARQLDEIVRIQDQQQQQDDNDDESDVGYEGYQQLPQGDDEGEDGYYQQLESDNDEDEESVDMKAPVSIEITSSNSLDSDTSDLIKSIMNNIKLPDEAVPEWAKKIPESAWFPRVNDKTK